MIKLSLLFIVACMAIALAEPKLPQQGVIHQIQRGVAGPNPYIFLTVPRGRSQSLVHGFEVIEDDDDEGKEDNDKHTDEEDNDDEDNQQQDDDDDDNNDDDDEEDVDVIPKNDAETDDDNEDDDEDEIHDVMNMNMIMKKPNHQIKNAKSTHMMVSREHAGAIMVPDEVIEIEGQSVIDEKTGKPALLLPRAILDTIPDGSVVALMERSVDPSAEAQERANRVIVRRRRKGVRRNVKRRRGANNKRRRVNTRGGNNRRRVNTINRVRINRRGGSNRRNRRRGNNRRKNNRRRIVYQG